MSTLTPERWIQKLLQPQDRKAWADEFCDKKDPTQLNIEQRVKIRIWWEHFSAGSYSFPDDLLFRLNEKLKSFVNDSIASLIWGAIIHLCQDPFPHNLGMELAKRDVVQVTHLVQTHQSLPILFAAADINPSNRETVAKGLWVDKKYGPHLMERFVERYGEGQVLEILLGLEVSGRDKYRAFSKEAQERLLDSTPKSKKKKGRGTRTESQKRKSKLQRAYLKYGLDHVLDKKDLKANLASKKSDGSLQAYYVRRILEAKIPLKDLWFLFEDSPQIAFGFTLLLRGIAKKAPEEIIPVMEDLIRLGNLPPFPEYKDQLVRILEFVSIPEGQKPEIVELLFELLQGEETKLETRSLSLKILGKLTVGNAALRKRVQAALAEPLPESATAFEQVCREVKANMVLEEMG